MQIEWEQLISQRLTTSRLEVPGGWIVKYETGHGIAMVYFPDPNHEWEL